MVEQSLSRFISPEETREFTAALREVVERGVTRNARLNPRSATGEVIPTTLNASALRDPDGNVIGAIGILRDMRAYEQVVRDLEESKTELQEKILDLEKFEEVVVGRELKMIALEKELEGLQQEVEQPRGPSAPESYRPPSSTADAEPRCSRASPSPSRSPRRGAPRTLLAAWADRTTSRRRVRPGGGAPLRILIHIMGDLNKLATDERLGNHAEGDAAHPAATRTSPTSGSTTAARR